MAGEVNHAGAKLYTPGQHLTLVADGVVVVQENDRILTRGLTLMQVQAARVQGGEVFMVQGTDWTDDDVAELTLSDAERWIDIQEITQDTLGDGTTPAPDGKINWTDHYQFIRVVSTGAASTTACLKLNSLGGF